MNSNQLTRIAKQRILPSDTMLMNSTKASESSLAAKVSNDLVAMTAPVIWLRTATLIPLFCSSVASNTLPSNEKLNITIAFMKKKTPGQRIKSCTLCSHSGTEPFNSQIKFAIPLTVNHTILVMLVQRI